MRKFFINMILISCTLILIFSLASCGKNDSENEAAASKEAGVEKPPEEETDQDDTLVSKTEDETDYVVRVGNVTYSVKQVQNALDKIFAFNEIGETTLSEEECIEAAENTIENFIIRGLAENRIHELGLDKLEKEVLTSLKDQANQTYEQLWQETRAQYEASELTDKQITMLLDETGSSPEAYYQEFVLGYELELLLEHYDVSVELNDEELNAFYMDNYVAPYEARYADNVPLYEEEVLFGEGDSLFIPDGYRKIQQILLPLPVNTKLSLDELNTRAEELADTAQKAYEEVASLGVEGKDISSAQNTYAEAKAELEQIDVEKGTLLAEVLPKKQKTVDEIFARLRAGEHFEDLAKLYGEEASDLPYHPDSKAWTEKYVQALRTLNEPGDVSQPVVVEDGIHIFFYAEDIPSGAVRLGADQRSLVETAARQNLSSQALTELVGPWRSEYEIETDISKLNLPE